MLLARQISGAEKKLFQKSQIQPKIAASSDGETIALAAIFLFLPNGREIKDLAKAIK
jgi:hypothetical protein